MKQCKRNTTQWYALGLAAVLLLVCLMTSTGLAWARYRSEVDKRIAFMVDQPGVVCLGAIETSEDGTARIFQPTNAGRWEVSAKSSQLEFAIANGISVGNFEDRDQKVYIRLIGSLGVLSEEKDMAVKLTVTEQAADDGDETEKITEYEARITQIAESTPQHNAFGDGWVFDFVNEDGAECEWQLEGGKLSYIDVIVELQSAEMVDTSLLQLQIISELVE